MGEAPRPQDLRDPLLVHDNPSFRDFVRALRVPATARVVPEQPVFPPMDELARVASANDLIPAGPPINIVTAQAIYAAAQ